MRVSFLTISIICSLNNLLAQISSPGRYRNLVQNVFHKNADLAEIKEYRLPPQDNSQLLAQAEADEAIFESKIAQQIIASDGSEEIIYNDKPPKSAPYQFGTAIDFVVDMNKKGEGQWILNDETNTKTWRFKVYSKDAHSISIYFTDFHLAPSTELYIIGPEETLGAFTSQNNKEDRSFGIAPVSGDFLILEYIEPLDLCAEHRKSSIVVSHIVHGFRNSPFSFKAGSSSSGSCHFNVACPEGAGKANSINSVALLITGKGTSFCTGAMINNVKQDGRQLFLTAEHCIGSTNVNNFMVGFHYQYKFCNSAFESKPQTNTVHGTRLLNKSDESDYALLEVVERIPDDWDVYMAGWDATPSTSRTGSFYGIHHPSSDTKKVSLFNGKLDIVRLKDINDGVNFWRVLKWTKGVTEPGSSGSPLFDSNGLIIGHLLGGESKCSKPDAPDYYGALSRDWVSSTRPISTYLDPEDTNTNRLTGSPLKQLRGHVNDETPITSDSVDPAIKTETITVTQTLHKTIYSTITVAKTTKFGTVTVTHKGERITATREVTKTISVPITITETVSRISPQRPIVRTVTVKKYF